LIVIVALSGPWCVCVLKKCLKAAMPRVLSAVTDRLKDVFQF